MSETIRKKKIVKVPNGWLNSTVDDVVDFIGGSQPPQNEFIYEAKKGYVRLIQTRDYRTDKYKTFIPEKRARKTCKKDDVLIGRYGPPIFQIFRGLEGAYNVALLKAKPKSNSLLKNYLYHYLKQEKLLRFLEPLSQRTGGQSGIELDALKSYPLPLPSTEEQMHIAEILDKWDIYITRISELFESYNLLRNSLMQQLLTGSKRFPEFNNAEWKEYELKKILSIVQRPVPRPDIKYTALSIRSHGKGTFLREVENPQDVMMDELYEVKENDLIVNITFAWEGAIALVKKSDEGALVSHRFPTFTINTEYVLPDYLKYLIIQRRFIYNLGVISPGGAGRNRVLDKKDFLRLKVFLPSIEEQKKIASVLLGVDKEISLLQTKLELIKTQKKGLMQKLLTGQIRVKV